MTALRSTSFATERAPRRMSGIGVDRNHFCILKSSCEPLKVIRVASPDFCSDISLHSIILFSLFRIRAIPLHSNCHPFIHCFVLDTFFISTCLPQSCTVQLCCPSPMLTLRFRPLWWVLLSNKQLKMLTIVG